MTKHFASPFEIVGPVASPQHRGERGQPGRPVRRVALRALHGFLQSQHRLIETGPISIRPLHKHHAEIVQHEQPILGAWVGKGDGLPKDGGGLVQVVEVPGPLIAGVENLAEGAEQLDGKVVEEHGPVIAGGVRRLAFADK